MSGDPRISVIVPCYDVERWLPRCLDATLAALPPDGELIAVDDGSTDGTLAILRARAATDVRMRIMAVAHAGVSAARNRALDVMRGEYVFFVDPDDAVEPDFFTSMVEALEREGADCCICGYSERTDGDDACRTVSLKGDYRFRSNGEIVRGYLPRIFGYSFADIRSWYAGMPLFSRREMAAVWRMAYRRDLVESRHVRFDESIELYEDAMFNVECLLGASSLTCVGRPLYRVTCRETGAMRTVPRDGRRYCVNKVRLVRKRAELDRQAGGALAPLYAGTCVLSALEILAYAVRGRVGRREGFRLLDDCLREPSVRRALVDFPLSLRRPAVALAVTFLRLWVRLQHLGHWASGPLGRCSDAQAPRCSDAECGVRCRRI